MALEGEHVEGALVEGARSHTFAEHFADGRPEAQIERLLIEEAPIAIEINGIGRFLPGILRKRLRHDRLAVGVPFTAQQEFYSPGFGAQKGDPAQFPARDRVGVQYHR